MNYQQKYLKYKNKYLKSKNQIGGMRKIRFDYNEKTITADVYDGLLCNNALMTDPVIASDGYSYERSYIKELLKKPNPKSPKTNEDLTKTLIRNYSLKSIINEFKEREFLSKKTLVYLYAGFKKDHYNPYGNNSFLPYSKQIEDINKIYKKYMREDISDYLRNIQFWDGEFPTHALEGNFNYLYFDCHPLCIEINFEDFEKGKNFVKEVNDKLNYVDGYPIKYGRWEVCAELLKEDKKMYDFSDERTYLRDNNPTIVKLYGGYYSPTDRVDKYDLKDLPNKYLLDLVLKIYSQYVDTADQKFKDFQVNLTDEKKWKGTLDPPTCMKEYFPSHKGPMSFNFIFDCKCDAINFIRDINIDLNINEEGSINKYGEWHFCATILNGESENDMMEFEKINNYITNYE
jgi:hypothetical protein